MAYTAMRAGEVFALKWDCLDFERQEIKVKRSISAGVLTETTKTHGARTVPTAAELVAILKAHRVEQVSTRDPALRNGLVLGTTTGRTNVRKGTTTETGAAPLHVGAGRTAGDGGEVDGHSAEGDATGFAPHMEYADGAGWGGSDYDSGDYGALVGADDRTVLWGFDGDEAGGGAVDCGWDDIAIGKAKTCSRCGPAAPV